MYPYVAGLGVELSAEGSPYGFASADEQAYFLAEKRHNREDCPNEVYG